MLVQLEQNVVAGVRVRYGNAVARSTEIFLTLRRKMGQCVLDHLVAMGRELIAVQGKLPYGQWMTWVRDDLGTDPRTAERIVDVAQAYEEDSTALSNLASFDATRLYRLARVGKEKRKKLTPETPLPVKPGGIPKPLAGMTSREFEAALDLYDPPPTGRRRPSAASHPSVPGIALPPLDPSSREAFARSFIAAVLFLISQAPLIRNYPGKLTAARKEEVESVLEKLRKLVLRWPAWARKHR